MSDYPRPAAGSANQTSGQQQQSQSTAFSTRSQNDTRKTGARAVQVASVPAWKSAPDVSACAPGI